MALTRDRMQEWLRTAILTALVAAFGWGVASLVEAVTGGTPALRELRIVFDAKIEPGLQAVERSTELLAAHTGLLEGYGKRRKLVDSLTGQVLQGQRTADAVRLRARVGYVVDSIEIAVARDSAHVSALVRFAVTPAEQHQLTGMMQFYSAQRTYLRRVQSITAADDGPSASRASALVMASNELSVSYAGTQGADDALRRELGETTKRLKLSGTEYDAHVAGLRNLKIIQALALLIGIVGIGVAISLALTGQMFPMPWKKTPPAQPSATGTDTDGAPAKEDPSARGSA